MGTNDERLGISLYVGDLHPRVTEEEDLFETFRLFSLRLCRELLEHGYVNFWFACNAYSAMECQNYTVVKGKTMRIMMQSNHVIGQENNGNLFVMNLDKSISSSRLHQIFSQHGRILPSCKDAEVEGVSKGSGFVQLLSENSAMATIGAVHKSMINAEKLFRSEADRTKAGAGFTIVYVTNLDEDVTEDILKDKLSECGNVSSVVIMKDKNMKSRRFGFVNFDSTDMDSMDGQLLGSKNLFVGRTRRKAKRMEDQTSNLYVMNLNASVDVDDRKLEGLVRCYGTPLDAKKVLYFLAGALNDWNSVEPKDGETGDPNEINGIEISEDILLHLLAFTTRFRYPSLKGVSKYFNETLISDQLFQWRATKGYQEPSLYFCIGTPTRTDWYTTIRVGERWECRLLPRMPYQHVSRTSVAAVGPHIFVIGGWGLSHRINTLYTFDARTNRWDLGTPMRGARQWAACGIWDGYIYVFGGTRDSTQAEKYNIDAKSWEDVTNPPVECIHMYWSFVKQSFLYARVHRGLVCLDMKNEIWIYYHINEWNDFGRMLNRNDMVEIENFIYMHVDGSNHLQVSAKLTDPWNVMIHPELVPEPQREKVLANLGGKLVMLCIERRRTQGLAGHLMWTEIQLGEDEGGQQTGAIVRRQSLLEVGVLASIPHCATLQF